MKAYLQLLIWVMLFVVIIEMIFPDSSYKKYLKLVMGCIIVYTLFKPLIAFIPTQGKSYDDYVRDYQEKLGGVNEVSSWELSYEEEKSKQQELLKETYEQNIKALIEKEVEVSVKSAEIEWQEEDSLQIETIILCVGEKEGEGEGSLGRMPSIKIGEKSSTIYGEEENLKNKIKTCLKNFYNVQDCNIYITVQKN